MSVADFEKIIVLDVESETVHFYIVDKKDKKNVKHEAHGYHAPRFSEEFFEKFGRILTLYSENNPGEHMQKVLLILPDSAFVTDIVNIPTVNKKAMNASLESALRTIYKNIAEIAYNAYPVTQNKQLITYGIVGVRKNITEKFRAVCSEHKISVASITFFSNALSCGVIALKPKSKNASFALLDVKERKTTFLTVVKGRTIGFYHLPFGYSSLLADELVSENSLFDHSPAEIVVLKAIAKAKAKQLTEDEVFEFSTTEENDNYIKLGSANEPLFPSYDKKADAKANRKLRGYMARELPADPDGFIYENFRIFMKWTLELLKSNQNLVNLSQIDTVYVNIPGNREKLFDKVNSEGDMTIRFEHLEVEGKDNALLSDLELYGALYTKQYGALNNF